MEDIEVLVYAGSGQEPGYLGRWCGQAQGSAEQPGTASGAHQDRKAAGVRVLYRGQIHDQLGGGRSRPERTIGEILALLVGSDTTAT